MAWRERNEVVAGRRMAAQASRAAARGLARLAGRLAGAGDTGTDCAPGDSGAGSELKYGDHWFPGDLAAARSVILDVADAEFFESSGKADCAELIAPLLTPDLTVLDLGCGVGRIALYVAPLCRTLWVVDASSGMLSMARERLKDQENVRYALSLDTRVPSVQAASVDLVYSILVLQHLEKEDAFLLMRDVLRMLVPGGRALLMFPNILSDDYLQSFIQCAEKGRKAIDNSARPHFYTPPEVERIVQAAGFSSVEVKDGTNMLALCVK
ncbi:MAG TPA: class I SAM-dependent methyltransferase [Actinomycetota bacterium]|nr:class I SAM-dependent methyltransferase [Actinomycetota bacterium]